MIRKKRPMMNEAEVMLPWPNMEEDMSYCRLILIDETRIEGSNVLKLFEKIDLSGLHEDPKVDDVVNVTYSRWMIRIQRHFIEKYGDEYGTEIATKAIMRLIAPDFRTT